MTKKMIGRKLLPNEVLELGDYIYTLHGIKIDTIKEWAGTRVKDHLCRIFTRPSDNDKFFERHKNGG